MTIYCFFRHSVYACLISLTSCFISLNSFADTNHITEKQALHFSQLALNCIHKEFPNSMKLYVERADQIKQPNQMHPAFYRCLDWHSSVHGHWLLVRLLRLFPEISNQKEIINKLNQSFTPENLKTELYYPIRSGTHKQSAFGLFLDWAEIAHNDSFKSQLVSKIKTFYLKDRNFPIDYEPSGEDFLSPCLMEADLLRRVLPQTEFAKWLKVFLPQIPKNGSKEWLKPGIVINPEDSYLVHLYGVNLSRAWALENIAYALPKKDTRKASPQHTAKLHKEKGIESVTDEHYSASPLAC